MRVGVRLISLFAGAMLASAAVIAGPGRVTAGSGMPPSTTGCSGTSPGLLPGQTLSCSFLMVAPTASSDVSVSGGLALGGAGAAQVDVETQDLAGTLQVFWTCAAVSDQTPANPYGWGGCGFVEVGPPPLPPGTTVLCVVRGLQAIAAPLRYSCSSSG